MKAHVGVVPGSAFGPGVKVTLESVTPLVLITLRKPFGESRSSL
ncbi:MAG: Hypothetical protein AJITA_01112 [Acetilactobacillus jinshanensis]